MAQKEAEMVNTLKNCDQGHLFRYWDLLNDEERRRLSQQLRGIDWTLIKPDVFRKNDQYSDCNGNIRQDSDLCSIPGNRYTREVDLANEEAQNYWNSGLEEIANSRVGVILMAGGQATRLGSSRPKCTFDLQLLSGKPLCQLQAERLLRLQAMAADAFPGKNGKIMWYIMTSEATFEATSNFFEEHKFFGLQRQQVVFFQQECLPCYDFDGKVFLESRNKVSMAPNGNGGLYRALVKSRILVDIQQRKLKYLHIYGVDNILVRVADPTFIGLSKEKQADCCNKVIEKIQPNEPVGVVCWVNGAAEVVEYSEISEEMSALCDSDGRLSLRAANIGNHLFTAEFLRRVCKEYDDQLPYHRAVKKIPYVTGSTGTISVRPSAPNGVKFEKFIFDVFRFAENFHVYEVRREIEFSPLKNAAGPDSPATCRRDLSKLHKRWLRVAGARLIDDQEDKLCEISPLLSYQGEGLDKIVNKKDIRLPICLRGQKEF